MKNNWMSVGLMVLLSNLAIPCQAQNQPAAAPGSFPESKRTENVNAWQYQPVAPAQTNWQPLSSDSRTPPPYGRSLGYRHRTPQSLKLMSLSTKIRSEKDEKKRESLAKELSAEMERLFDKDLEHREAELEKLESRLAKLRESVEKRVSSRDRIIKNRIESLMLEADGLGLPGERTDGFGFERRVRGAAVSYPTNNASPNFSYQFQDRQPKVLQTYPDGSRKVFVPVTKSTVMSQTRMVPFTKTQTQTRNRIVDGKRQVYQEQVPVTDYRQETHPVTVPMQTGIQVIVKKGQSIDDAVREFRKTEGDLFEPSGDDALFDSPGSDDLFESDDPESEVDEDTRLRRR